MTGLNTTGRDFATAGHNGGSASGGGSTRSAPKHHGWSHWPSWHTVSKIAGGTAVGIAVGVSVAGACATVVGCFVLAGVAAGAAAGAATYANSVALGDDEFSVKGLAVNTALGGGTGGLSAGVGAGVGVVAKAVTTRGITTAAQTVADASEGSAAPTAEGLAKSGASKSAGRTSGGSSTAGSASSNSYVTTTDALKGFHPSTPEAEYVFDPGTAGFAAGTPPQSGVLGSPHEQLARAIGANEATVLGGTVYRNEGRLVFTENSGHYGHRWTDAARRQFQNFLNGNGVEHEYKPWG